MAKKKKYKIQYPGSKDFPTAKEFTENNLRIKDTIDDIQDREILDGIFLQDVSLTVGSVNLVEHGLARDYQGYWIVSSDAQLIVYLDNDTTEDTSIYLPIVPSTSCTASIWVF